MAEGGAPPGGRARARDGAKFLASVQAGGVEAFPPTTVECQPAYGGVALPGGDGASQTCRFRNLYAIEGKLQAHLVRGQHLPDADMEIVTQAGYRGYQLGRLIDLKVHDSEEDVRVFLSGTGVGLVDYTYLTGATMYFVPRWHFNIGHALYEGLYPAFVSMMQWKEHEAPFRVVFQGWGVPDANIGRIDELMPGAFQGNAEVLGRIAGSGHLYDRWLGEREEYRHSLFETFVLGMGLNAQKVDMNANYSIGGGRDWGATRHFRDKVYRSAGMSTDVAARRRPGSSTTLRGILIDNKRWANFRGFKHPPAQPLRWIDPVIAGAARRGVDLKLIHWGKAKGHNEDHPGAFSGADTFSEQMRLIAATDIHISSPGTAMMYQHFLPDGAVHINLGKHPYFPMKYMEEYMAEGAPYIRALYYWPSDCNSTEYNEDDILSLVAEAKELIVDRPFEIPVPVGVNLSPVLKVAKAYGYITQDPVLIARKMPLWFLTPRLPSYRLDRINTWFPHDLTVEQCTNRPNMNACLWEELVRDFGAPFPNRQWCPMLMC